MKDIPLYKLEITDKQDGVFAVSVVEYPAIKKDSVFLSEKKKEKFKFSTKEDQQIITGPALIPDLEILRKDANGNYYNIVASDEVIKQVAIKFFQESNQNNATLEHEYSVKGITFFESWIISDQTQDKAFAIGLKDLPNGTWMLSGYVQDPELWKKIKEGNFNGFSIEAYFDKQLVNQKKQNELNIMDKFIEKFKKFLLADEEVKLTDAKLQDGTLIRIDDATQMVSVINTDGTLTPLKDGDYILEDGSAFIVKDGVKMSKTDEVKAKEAPAEEVKAETYDFILDDGTAVVIDGDKGTIVKKEDGSALPDGHYTLDSGEEFDVKDGIIVMELKKEEEKIEQAKVKLGLIKKNLTKEFKLSADLNIQLGKKIIELEAKVAELGNKPGAERTETNKVNFEKMSFAEQVVYNIKVKNGLIK